MAVGCARAKNNKTILTNHIVFIAVAGLTFLFFGSKLIFEARGGVFGMGESENLSESYKLSAKLNYVVDCLLCTAIACTQLQERALTEVYFFLSFLISGMLYPVVVAWIKEDGWLHRKGFVESGLGSSVLLVGGTAGLVCNLMLGPRFEMFYKYSDTKNSNQSQGITNKIIEKQKTSGDERKKGSTTTPSS